MGRACIRSPAPNQVNGLFVEVDGWTKFTDCFTHLHSGNPAKSKDVLLAGIMADATNQGTTKMAEACPGLSYEKLCWTADWHIREETYAKALAEIVNLQHRLPMAEQWGDGSTSSSDGQAFPIAMRRPVIAQTNAKYGRDPVVTFYTHISDRYAPFHTKAISSTVRDAPHVLDGLLGHDTDLRIRDITPPVLPIRCSQPVRCSASGLPRESVTSGTSAYIHWTGRSSTRHFCP